MEQRVAEVAGRIGRARVEGQRALVVADRVLGTTEGPARLAEIGVEVRDAVVDLDRALDEVDGDLRVSRLVGDDARQMQ